ncbi:TonB-dependent receptor [Niveibacterium sp.]|uniref:TonB-dependent receptor n=1 Tax=Niveibacterium sp. TaxID=2017444 RepID=UPI0035AEC8EF
MALCVALALATPGAVIAAEPQATDKDGESLPTITVTATRRPEALQKVPVAVTVLDGQKLAEENRNNIAAIAQEVPSVNFRTNGSSKDTSVFVRGVGTISTSPGVEPTVSTVLDGVVLARPGQATLDLLDVERVEILRGPQGTLFGKNASAGVVNIVTRAPGAEREAFVEGAWYSGGNEKRLRAGVSGGVNEQLRGSFNASWADYDGNVTNVANGKTRNGYDRTGLRARVDYDATPDLKLSLIGDYSKGTDTTVQGVITSLQTTAYPSGALSAPNTKFGAALLPVVPKSDNREVNNNVDTRAEERNYGLSAQIDWKLAGHTLTSITAWRGWENTQYQDLDRLSAPAAGLPQQDDKGVLDFNQYSQEFRITSPRGQFLEYVGGLFFLRAESDETYRRDVTAIAPAPSGYGEAKYSTRSDSASAYGEATFNFTEALRGIAGLRWTHDSLSYEHERVRNPAGAALAGVGASQGLTVGETSASAFSGRIGPQFDIAKGVTSYATYSRGYKGPAFNVFFNFVNPRDTLALKPETSDSFELGLKTTSFDNRLRINAAAFYTKYDNFQANFADVLNGTIVTRLINAGEVSTKGLEVDFSARPLTQLTISGAVARINARIDNFNCPVGAPTSCDVNGKPLPFSPDWKANIQGTWREPLKSGRFVDISSDYSWQSETQYSISQFADTIQPSYGIWNASVALVDAANGWRAALLVKNIANQSYATNLSHDAGVLNRWVPRDDQRYFGVQFRKDFF